MGAGVKQGGRWGRFVLLLCSVDTIEPPREEQPGGALRGGREAPLSHGPWATGKPLPAEAA